MSATPTTHGHAWREAPASRVRALIARAMLEEAPTSLRLGEIDLAPHQREAVARLRAIIARSGGALLADTVGLGKTYVALAIARDAARPLLVAPAALRDMWKGAMVRAGVPAMFVSTEKLSRRAPLAVDTPDLVIVDEAHHFRNPATRRYATLAALTQRTKVLLVTATPIHNASRELWALLALFLGSGAEDLPPAELGRCIVRRERAPSSAWRSPAPEVAPPRQLVMPPEDDLLEAIASLPPPVPPSDGDDGGALLQFALLRQWASSHGALAAALRRRLARAAALIAALEEGRHPSRSELSAWRFADEAVQLAFPALVSATMPPDVAELLERTRAHESAVRGLLRKIEEPRPSPSPDAERAACLRTVRDTHPGEKVVAFSQFADTVDALFRELRADRGVATLAGRGARVAGGAISRAEALRRFAPNAQCVPAPTASERIDLLLTTDLLSEGVNLQDASVVVHLDLPWTPARLEQRVGRLARPGAAGRLVTVYAFAPPATAERVLAVERRLRAKLSEAARSLGASGVILPSLIASADTTARVGTETRSPSQRTEELRATLERWLRGGAPGPRRESAVGGDDPRSPLVASARSVHEGALVLVQDGDRARLVALWEGTVTDDPDVIAETLAHVAADEPRADRAEADEEELDTIDPRRVARVLASVQHWSALHDETSEAELRLIHHERARGAVLRRVASALARAPAHARARLVPLAVAARRAATLPLGAGAELVLRDLAAAELPDASWLRALAEFVALQQRGRSTGRGDAPLRSAALILFGS